MTGNFMKQIKKILDRDDDKSIKLKLIDNLVEIALEELANPAVPSYYPRGSAGEISLPPVMGATLPSSHQAHVEPGRHPMDTSVPADPPA